MLYNPTLGRWSCAVVRPVLNRTSAWRETVRRPISPAVLSSLKGRGGIGAAIRCPKGLGYSCASWVYPARCSITREWLDWVERSVRRSALGATNPSLVWRAGVSQYEALIQCSL